MALSRPCSQMTRYTVSPPPFSRPSSVMSRTSKATSIRLPKANPMRCNVCSNKLDYQWVLPGLHNFCTHCLEDYILRHSRNKRCHCPICRAGIRLPKDPHSELTRTRNGHPRRIARFPQGTSLVICDVCDDAPAIYKCSECNEFFCEKCNRLHLRMKMGRDHHVAIMPAIRQVNEKLKVRVYCDIHDHEEIKFYCKKCDVPICRDCKVLGHEGHMTTSLHEIHDERKQRVSHSVDTAKGHLAKLKGEAIEIKNRKGELSEETEQTTAEIKQHANKIKDIIDEHADRLIEEVKKQHEESMAKLERCLDSVNKKIESIQELIDAAAIQMDTSTEVAFVNTSPSLDASLRASDVPSFVDKLWRKKNAFIKGDIDEEHLRECMGQVKLHAEGLFVPLPVIELQLHTSFNCDQNFRSTSAIATLPDGTAWVCNGYKNKIQRFDTMGRILQIEATDYDIDDMVACVDGTVLLTEYNGQCIRKLGQIHIGSYFAKTDMYLRGITISKEGTHVIVVGNDVPVTKMQQIQKAKIMIFSLTGRRIREITINRGLNLYRICHTMNDDFVISTGVAGKYLVINSDGASRFTYTASGTADGVACDEHGLTILGDMKDDTIHLLDGKGKPLPFTYSLNKPSALAVDNKGNIWIGDASKIRLMKYM